MRKNLYAFLFSLALFFSNYALSQSSQTLLKAESAGFDFGGSTTVTGYEKWNDVLSFSDGIQGCVTQNKGCASSLTSLNIMIPLSHAVTAFRSAQLQNKNINSSDLVMIRSVGDGGLVEFYRIHMEDIRIISLQEGASSESPFISIELQPTRIAWKITSITGTGTAGPSSSYGWDFAKNLPYNPF